MNGAIRFGVIVNQKKVLDRIFQSKKDKQRYLDYVYKIELKNCDSSKVSLIRAADIVANRIYFMALNRNIEKLEGIYLSTLP